MYMERGVASLEQLRGMFAFAVWDEGTGELLLARDRVGIKPLYYAHRADGSLYFASEIKAVLASGVVRAAVNRAAVPDYLANHAPSGAETLFADVRRLPAGHFLVWRDGRVTVKKYWDLEVGALPVVTGDRQAMADFSELFRDAVELRLMADVPLGVFLSGGVDSAAITATMCDLVTEPIKTFSVGFSEAEANELHYARLVARRYGTDHHEIVLTPEEFFAALPRLVWQEDEPLGHPASVPLYYVARLAAAHVKVVLTGEGADELLAGYGRYWKTMYNMRLGRWYERLTPSAVRRMVRYLVDSPAGRPGVTRLARSFLSLPANLESMYLDNFAVFPRYLQEQLFAPTLRSEMRSHDPYVAARGYLTERKARSLLDQMLYLDTKVYLHELLMKQDQMSMAASVESRVPFLDHKLVEYVASLPDSMKLRRVTTKVLLRKAMNGILPPEILTRRKMGFPVPLGAWFRGRFRDLVEDYVHGERAASRGWFSPGFLRRLLDEHVSGKADHAGRLWALVNFECWQRIFIDGDDPVSLGERGMAPAAAVHGSVGATGAASPHAEEQL
jgi:asparagine synthase (glutamine-hydrolysing)